MPSAINHLLPIRVRTYPGGPMTVETRGQAWLHKPFKFFAADGAFIGEVVYSTSEGAGINDLADATMMASHMAVATTCHDVLLTACQAVDADIESTGAITAETAALARKAIDMARKVERLVQA